MEMIQDETSEQIIESAKRLAKTKNVNKLTVRDILKDLNLTNRVFYNRFHNIDEVLDILYRESIIKVRESLAISWDEQSDYWAHVQSVVARTLIYSYESRQSLSQFIFETDSATNVNFFWWEQEIRKLIVKGKETKHIREELDEKAISYSIWCFIRGFIADAIGRNLEKEEAMRQFSVGFGCFLDGMKRD